MNSRKSYIINILIIIVITIISLYFSIGNEYKNVLKTVIGADLKWLIVILGLMIGYYVIDGKALWYFGAHYKKDYTYKEGFTNAIIGTLFNGITPSSSGGQFAQVVVFGNQGIDGPIASSILMMCFIAYQIVLVGFTGLIMLIESAYFVGEGVTVTSMATLGFMINFGVTGALLGGALSSRIQNFLITIIVRVLTRLHILKDEQKIVTDIKKKFQEFRHELFHLLSYKDLCLKLLLCNVLKQIILYSIPFFSCIALHIDVHMSDFIHFLALTAIINLINTFLPIPGASGGSEGCYMILFGFLGQVHATSSMFVWRFFSFYVGMILGTIVLILYRRLNET